MVKDSDMFNPFNALANITGRFQKGGGLGIDIGTNSIKAIQLGRQGDTVTLENYGELHQPDLLQALQDPARVSANEELEVAISAAINQLLTALALEERRATMALPAQAVLFDVLSLPQVEGKELHNAVLYRAERILSAPLDEVVLDWEVIGNRPATQENTPGVEVLIAAVSRDVVDQYVRIAQGAGIQLAGLEAEPFALARVASRLTDGVFAILDFGGSRSTLTIAENTKIHAVREVSLTGTKLTTALASALSVDMDRAEELKREYGLTISGGADFAHTLNPFIDGMVNELRSAFSDFERHYGEGVGTFFLVGGAAKLKGLDVQIEQHFSESVVGLLAALQGIAVPEPVRYAAKDIGVEYAVAIGLALRHGDDGRKHH